MAGLVCLGFHYADVGDEGKTLPKTLRNPVGVGILDCLLPGVASALLRQPQAEIRIPVGDGNGITSCWRRRGMEKDFSSPLRRMGKEPGL